MAVELGVHDDGAHSARPSLEVQHELFGSQEQLHRAGAGRTVGLHADSAEHATGQLPPHHRRQDIGLTDRGSRDDVGGVPVEVVGIGTHHHPTLAQHGDSVGEGQGLVLVVGHEDRRGAGLRQDAAHIAPETGAQ